MRQKLKREREANHLRTVQATGLNGLDASSTVSLLITLWNSGHMTPQTLQKIAKAVHRDMGMMRKWNFAKMISKGQLVTLEMDYFEDLEVLSKIGASGDEVSNCLRDLERHLPPTSIAMPDPIPIPMKIKTGDPPVIEDVAQWLLLPHVLFSHIYHNFKEVWQKRFVGNSTQLREFWKSQEGNPQYRHPDFDGQKSSMEARCIPLRMHSDGVVVTGRGRSWSKMADVYSWGPVLGWGNTDTMLYFIWAVWEHQLSKVTDRTTYAALANVLRWSFTALWEGKWPTHDHNGKEFPPGTRSYELSHGPDTRLAEGYFALLWVIESDLDFLAQFWNFPRNSAASPCAYCPCTNRFGHMPFDNFSTDPPAPWMSQIRNVDYMLDHPESFTNPMYRIPGVTALTVCIDWMHTKYLGTDQYFLGSVLFTLCHHLLPTGTPEANCAWIWKHIKAEYRARNTTTRYRVLRLNMFGTGSGGYPCLKGKAHAIKELGLILRDLFDDWHDSSDPYQVAILHALNSSARLEQILLEYKSDFKFPAPIAAEFKKLCLLHVRQQQALYQFGGHRVFNITFKHHWLVHAGHRALYQNPRMGWCFMGEDLMLKVRTVTHPCTFGTKGEVVHKKLLRRMIRDLEGKFLQV